MTPVISAVYMPRVATQPVASMLQRADETCAVAADQVLGGVLDAARRPVEGHDDAGRRLAHAGHLVSASHRDPELGQPVAQHLLGPGLRQAEHSAVIFIQHAEVDADAAEVPHRTPPEIA